MRSACSSNIAWCAAAVVLPVVAGRLFDLTRDYGAAVKIAAAANALGLLVALGLPRQASPRGASRAG
jgi:OFA family oxalate/formate antiporter-like MFS transporter